MSKPTQDPFGEWISDKEWWGDPATKPTQAQIEALSKLSISELELRVAKAIARQTVLPLNSDWDGIPEYLKERCLMEARIALTAAAEVGKHGIPTTDPNIIHPGKDLTNVFPEEEP